MGKKTAFPVFTVFPVGLAPGIGSAPVSAKAPPRQSLPPRHSSRAKTKKIRMNFSCGFLDLKTRNDLRHGGEKLVKLALLVGGLVGMIGAGFDSLVILAAALAAQGGGSFFVAGGDGGAEALFEGLELALAGTVAEVGLHAVAQTLRGGLGSHSHNDFPSIFSFCFCKFSISTVCRFITLASFVDFSNLFP
jgi:hypothetical protein